MNRTFLSAASAVTFLFALTACGPNGDATPDSGISNGDSEGPIRAEERPAGTFQPGPESAIDTTVENAPTGRGTLQMPGARAPLTDGSSADEQQQSTDGQ